MKSYKLIACRDVYLSPLLCLEQHLVQQPEQLLLLLQLRRVDGQLRLERLHVLEDEVDLSGLARQLHQVEVDVEAERRGLVQRLEQRPHHLEALEADVVGGGRLHQLLAEGQDQALGRLLAGDL